MTAEGACIDWSFLCKFVLEASINMDDEYEPSNVGNFLERYHSWRNEMKSSTTSSPSPPVSPTTPVKKNSASQDVWKGVFQPYGKSPTGASRYDRMAAPAESPEMMNSGKSLSEIHDFGLMKHISLDEPKQ